MNQFYRFSKNCHSIDQIQARRVHEEEIMTTLLRALFAEENKPHSLAQDISPRLLQIILTGGDISQKDSISKESLTSIYRYAYKTYLKGQIDCAKLFYQFLCTVDMYNADYLMGLAAINLQEKNYIKALDLYLACLNLEESNYLAMLYAGQCSLYLTEPENAKIFFHSIAISNAPPGLKNLARRLLLAL